LNLRLLSAWPEAKKPSKLLGEVVSAFANATGGTIVIGVAELIDHDGFEDVRDK
jgi:predicted HTH transcriptional regulator